MANEKDVQHVEAPRTESIPSDSPKSVPIDTVHGDEALKIMAAGHGGSDTWEAHEEKKLVRKIDLRLMPILCITYGIQYADKAMLAQAVSPLLASPQSTMNPLLTAGPLPRHCLV